ncbi:MAG: hypothetical protein K2X72_23030 [Reyranella sp.]|nr:hypothetical protein [Reyranella sp.]
MSAAKLHINLTQGLIEAEGDEAFVRAVYEDFKERLNAKPALGRNREEKPDDGDDSVERSTTPRRRSANRKAPSNKKGNGDTDASAAGVSKYKPKRDTSLDLAKLRDFVVDYTPKNMAERILLYAEFLKTIGAEPCTVDQIYSCFLEFRTTDRIPEAFGQNLINTRGEMYGYIDFTTINDIRITTTGMNHFSLKMKKKGESA